MRQEKMPLDQTYLTQAWNRFLSTGEIADYLQYKQLEHSVSEVAVQNAAQDQWHHSPGPYDGGGGQAPHDTD